MEGGGYLRPTLTDLYQLSMCYSYWEAKKHDDIAVFDLFFRKNPFQGEYSVFCGLDTVLSFLENFRFSAQDIEYVKLAMPRNADPKFFEYLKNLDCRDLKVWALDEGVVAFPKVPLLIVQGPLGLAQLLETILLNLINFPSLVCTNASRFRLAAGEKAELLEFGLRRAQGPDGAMSASKYCYLGGFDGTSNVLAGQLYGIPIRGTHAHSFVTSFQSLKELRDEFVTVESENGGERFNLRDLAVGYLGQLCALFPHILRNEMNEGEFAAFITYASCFPSGFLALVDTYDVLKSGVINFCACGLALQQLGFKPVGVRLDSGDLAYLSRETRKIFQRVAERFNLDWFANLKIVASNDINEETLYSLKEQGNEIDCYGVGTHLVTCQKQPALGCVYKLVELKGKPRVKLSEDVEKMSIPGKKSVYRLFGEDGKSILDLMMLADQPAPVAGHAILCRHPFQEQKRAYVTPSTVENLHNLYWDGKIVRPILTLNERKAKVTESINSLRSDHKRNLNPTPYKVSVSERLYDFTHELWLKNAPIGQLK